MTGLGRQDDRVGRQDDRVGRQDDRVGRQDDGVGPSSRHSREGGNPFMGRWAPAFAGATLFRWGDVVSLG